VYAAGLATGRRWVLFLVITGLHKVRINSMWHKYTYGTPTKFPELFRLQQASPKLPLHPLNGSRVFFYGYFICLPLITAYSVNTSFIDCSYSHIPCGCSVTRLFSQYACFEIISRTCTAEGSTVSSIICYR